MLNFRKLKQDFSSNVLKEGKDLYDKNKVISAKILKLDEDAIRVSGKILGNFDNPYESEIEIDRFESQTVHSNCDCTYRYDCQHLAAIIFFLEEKMDSLIVEYSKQEESNKSLNPDLLETFKKAESQEEAKQDANYQRQVLQEYVGASQFLAEASFFHPEEENVLVKAELASVFNPKSLLEKKKWIEFQLALRLPSRSKPLHIPNIKMFFEAIKYEEPISIASKNYFFSLQSFDPTAQMIIQILKDHACYQEDVKNDRAQRVAMIDNEVFGMLLAEVFDQMAKKNSLRNFGGLSEDLLSMPSLFLGSLENPLHCSFSPAFLQFKLEYIQPPASKILLNPSFIVDQNAITVSSAVLFECTKPGLLHQDVYYRFPPQIKRMHLKHLRSIDEITIPEPLFGTFVENSLPELKRYVEISNPEVIEKFITLPFAGNLDAKCSMSYLNGELEANLLFSYDGLEIKASPLNLTFSDIRAFVTKDGILARNLVEENKIIQELFQDFEFNPSTGSYLAKSEKKIVEFMTEIVPKYQERVLFDCPQNLLDQFVYDQTQFTLKIDYKNHPGFYSVDLKVDGPLKGINLDLLWECVSSKRSFIELTSEKRKTQKGETESIFSKILVLDLSKISKIVQIFDEMGIKKLDDHIEDRPLWSLVSLDDSLFKELPIKFSMTQGLKEIRKQMLGEKEWKPSEMPKEIQADLRSYQKEGIHWLERLRIMYLNGILADDMGLGKTLQAIVAITQSKKGPSLVVCPTSLLYNWKEEINKFNPKIQGLIIDGSPQQRKKMIASLSKYDLIITSYTLLQKDIELYKTVAFTYAILDEAQHIKNRGTRNAKSVKMIQSMHKLILTGTPIENCLEELWSLFDFLMPGLLSSYDRFVEKYVRSAGDAHTKNLEFLKKKVSPFILRRMKADVLSELPPVSEITYHCQLGNVQLDLYRSYAQSAKDELIKLVAREGFDKVQIHVLATLTRLKQICCHPAIFAKEKAEVGDSAKYEMLLELVQSLIEGNHKTVIFSQYTQMLKIMKDDFEQRGYKFCYLDGSTKNRLQIVNDFNENDSMTLFLVSLKAGGTGLNITGADTVIHYDMWWNPAVENQATDRVHRIGQKKSVSAYKLVTLGTIEEKILEMQKRKKGLVKKIVSCDDEAISKLTWEEVLELLQA